MFSTADLLTRAEHAPSAPGAYVLLIGLPVPVEVALPGKPKTTLCAGRYLYCGSAKGQEVFGLGWPDICVLKNQSAGTWTDEPKLVR